MTPARSQSVIGWAELNTGITSSGDPPLTLQRMLGTLLAPIAWFAGVPWSESRSAGSPLGILTVLNQLFAYKKIETQISANPRSRSPRARLIMTYALCGFANIASIGIQVGGISTPSPPRAAPTAPGSPCSPCCGAITSLMAAAAAAVVAILI